MTGPARADAFDGSTPAELAEAWGAPAVETWIRVSSTNDRAIALAVAGAAPGTTVVADEQTAGRGRRGASWHSAPRAGLWMSTVLDPSVADARLPLLVGVACAEGIEALVDDIRVLVKWPNDVLVGRRKLGGILVERVSGQVVVGIGINRVPPAGGFVGELDGCATALEVESHNVPPRKELAGRILSSLSSRLRASEPFDHALGALSERDALRDRHVDTDACGPGIARGVDGGGALLLERADGTRVRVVSGSVRLVGPDGAGDGGAGDFDLVD